MIPRARQHACNNVGGAYALGALNGSETADVLDGLVDVITIDVDTRVVAMDNDVDTVLVKERLYKVGSDDVGHVHEHLVDPFDALNGNAALLFCHDGRALVGTDLVLRTNTDDENISQGSGLPEGVGVAEMHGVEAAVHVDDNRSLWREARTRNGRHARRVDENNAIGSRRCCGGWGSG